MPRITIDGREVDVPAGATVLEAARRLGIDIPTLCHLGGYEPSASCLVCVVKLRGSRRFVPSCATRVVDSMAVESETDEVRQARRTALELLLSDHLGDCVAPCELACPVHMDIPAMLREIQEGDFAAAIRTIKRDIALPAVLGRVCPKPCEKGCRRGVADESIAICALKAQVAEFDLALETPYRPACEPDSGKRVAIVGAGPSGLAAAFHLARAGHRVTLVDDQPLPGGRLRTEFDAATLPLELVDSEIVQILEMGVSLLSDAPVADKAAFDRLRRENDAVLVCCGASGRDRAADWGLAATDRGIRVEKGTYRTSVEGVFAGGNAVRTKGLVVRSVADGKEAAEAIDAFLRAKPLDAPRREFTVRAGRLDPDELAAMIEQIEPASGDIVAFRSAKVASPRDDAGDSAAFNSPIISDTIEAARRRAARCMHCDCRGRHDCRLKRYAEQYDAHPNRYDGTRRKLVFLRGESGVIFEPGKCIDCELCIQIASKSRDVLGLAFIGRGFDVRVGVPFDRSLDAALGRLAAECVAACPTAALSLGEPRPISSLPILGQR
ncbi:MAG: FAD-dependent oxidoreductase [Pirellulaceae bacterium]|nr:FAD-dependent oxidoreductase [Pirellulaceae bacterium]